jgi:hypothetical protein
MNLVYCDFIAATISENLPHAKMNGDFLLDTVSKPMLDLSEEGYFVSTKKEIIAKDIYGTSYKITVEEVDE